MPDTILNEIDALFDEPFYLGASVADLGVPFYLPVAIGGHPYLIDPEKYKRTTVPTRREPFDNSKEPGEHSLNTTGFWRKSQENWWMGSGQRFLDYGEASNRERFMSSKGVDCWTWKKLTLLPDTTQRRASANTNLALLSVNGRLYMVDGSVLVFTADPTPASPVWVDSVIQPSSPKQITSVCTDGSQVWAACGTNGVRVTQAGAGSSAAYSAYQATVVGYSNGRLVAAGGNSKPNETVEIKADGTAVPLFTHPNPNFVWDGFAFSPHGIYMWGHAGTKSEIYISTTVDATGALAAPIWSAGLPPGETVNQMLYYGGTMVLATSRGVRLATIGSSFTTLGFRHGWLEYGPLWPYLAYEGFTIPGGVGAMDSQGEYLWFGWNDYDTASTGLGRAAVARFTSEQVPAYASDLMAGTTAAPLQGNVISVCCFGDRRYFAVSGSGLWGQNATFVASGDWKSGFITYDTNENKLIASFDLRHDPLPLGAEIDVSAHINDDPPNGQHLDVAVDQVTGIGPATPYGVGGTAFERLDVHLVIHSTPDQTQAPAIRRWTMRALPAPIRIDEILCPIIMRSRVENDMAEGADIYMDVFAEFAFLKNLEQTAQPVAYQEGGHTMTAYVDGIQVEPYKWGPDANYFESLLTVRLLTIAPGS